MARARGCDLHAIVAGAVICWAVMDGVGVAQESAEVMEDLGDSYMLGRRTTSQGSVIETLLFAGQAIVTEIAAPARSDVGVTAGTTGAAVRVTAGNMNAAGGEAANLPPSMGPGFGGTWLAGEIVDGYLVLHRIRATGPVTHEIFHEGHKVGSVTEVDWSGGARKLQGRNSFAFEATDDRFVVHLTQPDGTRIHATTERGRFSGEVVERVAAVVAPQRSALATPPSRPQLEPVQPSIGPASEPQRLARPQEAAGRIMVEEPARQPVPAASETVPLPRAFPYPRLRPSITAIPVQTASPSSRGSNRNTPTPAITVPPARSKPPVASVSALPRGAPSARPVASSHATAAPKSTMPESTEAVPPVRSKSTVTAVATPASRTAKPIVPTLKTGTSVVKPKPAPAATANARRPQSVAAKPVTAGTKPSRSAPSGTSSQ